MRNFHNYVDNSIEVCYDRRYVIELILYIIVKTDMIIIDIIIDLIDIAKLLDDVDLGIFSMARSSKIVNAGRLE